MSDNLAMPLYNWKELGLAKNVADEQQKEFCDTSIYQILPVKYLLKILRNQSLRFNNIVISWEDPYELFLLKQKIHIEGRGESVCNTRLLYNYYGQCWSLQRESDAMWRIYSRDREGVRIKTSVLKMIKVLDQTRGMMWTCPLFGRVSYHTQNEISDWINMVSENGSGNMYSSFSESLFIKRSEFEHENEVRFIILNGNLENDPVPKNVHSDHIEMPIDPYDFIEEIALDPRLSDDDFLDRKTVLSSICKNIPISKSDLYAFESKDLYLKETPMCL